MTELLHSDAVPTTDIDPSLEPSGTARKRPSFQNTWQLILSDLHFRCLYENKTPKRLTYVKLLRHPGVTCVIRARLQHYFCTRGWGTICWLMRFLNVIFYGVEISEFAQIGAGLLIVHANSIIIDGDVSIGERCVLFHQNAIVNSPFYEPGEPPGPVSIGDDVVFGGGSCAYGNIVLGNAISIGANSVVNRSFPSGASLFGVPARIVGRKTIETLVDES